MKINFTHIRIYILVLSSLVLFDSCRNDGKFPLTIDDIDTLTIYNNLRDSLAKISVVKTNMPVANEKHFVRNDSLVLLPSVKWTICTGVFEVKQNAKRKFNELKKESNAYLIVRENKHYITTGTFTNKDSALAFRKINKLKDTFILEIKPGELLLQKFPD